MWGRFPTGHVHRFPTGEWGRLEPARGMPSRAVRAVPRPTVLPMSADARCETTRSGRHATATAHGTLECGSEVSSIATRPTAARQSRRASSHAAYASARFSVPAATACAAPRLSRTHPGRAATVRERAISTPRPSSNGVHSGIPCSAKMVSIAQGLLDRKTWDRPIASAVRHVGVKAWRACALRTARPRGAGAASMVRAGGRRPGRRRGAVRVGPRTGAERHP